MLSLRQLYRLLNNKHKPKPRAHARRARLTVETLESRLVPAVTTAFSNGVLTISMGAPGVVSMAPSNHVSVAVESNGGIDVGLVGLFLYPGGVAPPFPNNVLADQMGVTSIVVQDASQGAAAPNQEVDFGGAQAFSQAITTINIETVVVNEPITGAVSGNAGTVDVAFAATIQNGVDLAAPGATVNVAAGTYEGLTIVNRSLTLKGNFAGVNAQTRMAGQEFQAETKTDSGTAGAFDLEADNVVLDGFMVGQVSPSPNAAPAILTSASHSGYQIRNNVIETSGTGLSLGSNGANQTIVDQNAIQYDTVGATAHDSLSNLLFENNEFTGTQSAMSLIGAASALSNLTIADNTFNVGTNLTLTNVTNSTIRGNDFIGSLQGVFVPPFEPAPPPVPTAPAVVLAGGDVNISITGNSFTDRGGTAISVADLALGSGAATDHGANSAVSIINNTINQQMAPLTASLVNGQHPMIDLNGVAGTSTVSGNILSLTGQVDGSQLLVDGLVVEGASTGAVNIFNNEFEGNGVDTHKTIAGVDLLGTLPTSAVINIRNNFLRGFGFGLVANALPTGSSDSFPGTQVHANFNDLTGNALGPVQSIPIFVPGVTGHRVNDIAIPIILAPAPDILDLQDNWWGVTTAGAIGVLIPRNPTPTTWLTSGVDSEPDVTGFQPDLSTVFNGSTVPPQPPTLDAVGTQNLFRNQGPVTIFLAADPNGGPAVTYGAYLPAQEAVVLQQELQLRIDPAGLYTNVYAEGEKWLRGVTNQFGTNWYFLLGSGQLYAWDGKPLASGAIVATLTPKFWSDPSLLVHPPVAPAVQISVAGNQLTIDPGTFVGSCDVIVDATNGQNTVLTTFTVNVTSRAPSIVQTPDQILTNGQNQLTVPISVANPDNVPLTYSTTAGNLGYVLGQQYHLTGAGSYYVNFYGAQEKWLKGDKNAFGNNWYFVLPSGQFLAWDGTQSATGTLLASLDPIYYQQPSLLAAAQPMDMPSVLKQALNLTTNGNLYQNYGGAQEKWLMGNVNAFGNVWYFIKPNGQLYAWNGASHQASGELLATLDLIDYTQPQRLYAPTSMAFSVSMTGNTLTISRAPGYLGSFDVLISVTDGVTTAIERLHVTAA